MKNWLRSVRNRVPEQKTLTHSPLISLHMARQAVWTPRDYHALAREGYQRNPIVYRCVRLIAESAASVPLCAREDGTCHAPVTALLAAGNTQTAASEILENFYGYLQVSGNAYLKAALIDDVPAALYAMRPDRMQVLADNQGRAVGWEYSAGAETQVFRRDAVSGTSEIHHMRLFHPANDSYGFSPLEAAAQAIDVHNEGGSWTKALLDNSARPSGALVYKGSSSTDRMSDDQFDRLKTELEAKHKGARHAGRPMVLEGGLDWKPMSLSPSDMDFTEARREAAREIALAFGVPPMLLGIPGDNTYANYREANQAFWRQTIVPLVQKTARGLEGWLRPYFGEGLTLSPDLDGVPALSEERAALWARLSAASFLTDNERRDMAGLEVARG